jgi:hypothetical protein
LIEKIKIELVERIKKPIEGNRFLNGFFHFLTIILYPLIILGGLIFILIMGIYSLFQQLFSSDKNIELPATNQTNEPIKELNIWTGTTKVKLFERYKGEIRFGPAYLSLRSEPEIQDLKNKIFGDWNFNYKDGILLQQWLSTDDPNTNLLFLNYKTKKLITIENNIPSVLWNIVETADLRLELNCDTGTEILKYKIEI